MRWLKLRIVSVLAGASCLLMPHPVVAAPLGTEFTYQGRLNRSGQVVTDTCNLQFSLWDAVSGPNQVGVTQTVNGVSVDSGLFTVTLNAGGEFGATAFSGDARWLEIAIQCTGDPGFTTLSPRQPLTAAPYARFAAGPWVTNGSNLWYTLGNVGIGTSSPDHKLTVVGPIRTSDILEWGGAGSVLQGDQGGGIELGPASGAGGEAPYIDLHYGGGAAQDFSARIQAAGNDRLDLATSTGGTAVSIVGGKVGIGSTAPDSRLQSVQAGDWNGTEFSPHALLLSSGGATGMELYGGGDDTNGVCYLQSVRRATASRTLALNARGGSVGVGTASPSARLHVAGTGRFDGALTASGGLTLATTTRYFSIPGNGFQPKSQTTNYLKFQNYVRGFAAADSVSLFAPVQLPHGAIVTSLEAQIVDNSAAEDITLELTRISDAGSLFLMASASSSASSPSVQTLADNTIGSATIDNDVYSYSIESTWTVPATLADIRLYRARVAYTITSPLP
jgi:hypothetical protein